MVVKGHNATEHLKMIKMVNFMLCIFYRNLKKKKRSNKRKQTNTSDSVAQKLPTALGCTSVGARNGAPMQ